MESEKEMETMESEKFYKAKNKFWLKTARILEKEGKLRDSCFLLEAWEEEPTMIVGKKELDPTWYYSLVGLYFEVEGKNMAMFIPLPVLEKYRYGRKIIRIAHKVVSRDWHDFFVNSMPLPNAYYPPEEEEEDSMAEVEEIN
jgi:hypothetical protein